MTPAKTRPPVVLTIAGTDPSGGAGIQADLQVFRDHGCYGTSAITAVVWQNTQGVGGWRAMKSDELRAQIDAVWRDFDVDAVKIGMIGSGRLVEAIRDFLETGEGTTPVVLDPVMAAGADGHEMMTSGGRHALVSLTDHVDLLTPNIPEARRLVGDDDDAAAIDLVEGLLERGWKRVLLKGGHLRRQPSEAVVDWYGAASEIVELRGLEAVDDDVRGTGCQLSSAIAAGVARGKSWRSAIDEARDYLHRLITESSAILGAGRPLVVRSDHR